MKCKEIKYYLIDYADGHLINEMREEIKDHLDICTDCKNYYTEIIILISEAHSLPKEIHPSKDLWEGISERTSKKKKPAIILPVYNERNSFYESGKSNTRFKKPGKKRSGLFIISAAASAVLLGILLGIIYYTHSTSAFWSVDKLAGTPIIGSEELADHGLLKVGDWLETDDKSRARLKIGMMGEVEIQPNSRLKLVETTLEVHRISLNHGKINAAIWAPPGLFIVETPSATAIDLGCMYNLEVAEDGSGLLKVISGWVAFQAGEIKSLIPTGALCKTKNSFGPGTPYFEDASEQFKAALDEFDFNKDKKDILSILLKEAREKDALSLWHILSKVNKEEREKTYSRMTELIAVPEGITFEGVMNKNRQMMDVLWESLGYGSRSLWNYL
jgi:hypothetical protein